MQYYRKFLWIIGLLLFAQAQAAVPMTCQPADKQKIERAVKLFLEKNNTIPYRDILVSSKKCYQNFALAMIHPKKPVTDDAKMYLQKVSGHWQVIAYGTDFSPTVLAKIPMVLREQ